MEHRFGLEADFALGIEEELLLVDETDFGPANIASELVGALNPERGEITNDVYEALIECSTPVVMSAPEGVEYLARFREQLRDAGAAFIGGGMHPNAAFGDIVHVPLERYEAIHREMRGLVARTPTAAVHVHVGMPDHETAITVFNGLRAFLPLLQALAAHSPYWHGQDSGLASARALMFRAFPRSTIPPAFDDWGDYEALVEWCVAAAEVDDYTYLWWDIRPSPDLGTVEVRAMDAQTHVEHTLALTALIQAMVKELSEHFEAGKQLGAYPYEMLDENKWLAARHGMAGELVDLPSRDRVPAKELARRLYDRLREHAQDLGSAAELEAIEDILENGNGAARQRVVYEANHDYQEVMQEIVEATRPA